MWLSFSIAYPIDNVILLGFEVTIVRIANSNPSNIIASNILLGYSIFIKSYSIFIKSFGQSSVQVIKWVGGLVSECVT